MLPLLLEFILDEDGATMAEYGLIAALLALPSFAILIAIANTCGATLSGTGNGLTSIGATNP